MTEKRNEPLWIGFVMRIGTHQTQPKFLLSTQRERTAFAESAAEWLRVPKKQNAIRAREQARNLIWINYIEITLFQQRKMQIFAKLPVDLGQQLGCKPKIICSANRRFHLNQMIWFRNRFQIMPHDDHRKLNFTSQTLWTAILTFKLKAFTIGFNHCLPLENFHWDLEWNETLLESL